MNERIEQAREIVKKYMWISSGAGIIPVPILDISIITAVQLKMISCLAKHYEIPFSKSITQSIITSLGSTITISSGSRGIIGSTLKAIPVLGNLSAPFIMPTFAGTATYALGIVFIQHFESGGTFLDLDPDKTREFYKKEFIKKSQAY
ncbi:conserved membrane hypothetical protein [Desulfamplus magnetovallimortis]|uniref:GTPase domain-containing protein n=1 Tax=Desulfamplus magnetovallimortis TaxID=1246637 RepID=A0A1W1HKV2_9BACT|nr:YcjF family protein [Desulfamplus magnetovallimortis]SLM33121.1 conserved membrane hypothetical protein [Desulfamplus magnetovallimortis]